MMLFLIVPGFNQSFIWVVPPPVVLFIRSQSLKVLHKFDKHTVLTFRLLIVSLKNLDLFLCRSLPFIITLVVNIRSCYCHESFYCGPNTWSLFLFNLLQMKVVLQNMCLQSVVNILYFLLIFKCFLFKVIDDSLNYIMRFQGKFQIMIKRESLLT